MMAAPTEIDGDPVLLYAELDEVQREDWRPYRYESPPGGAIDWGAMSLGELRKLAAEGVGKLEEFDPPWALAVVQSLEIYLLWQLDKDGKAYDESVCVSLDQARSRAPDVRWQEVGASSG